MTPEDPATPPPGSAVPRPDSPPEIGVAVRGGVLRILLVVAGVAAGAATGVAWIAIVCTVLALLAAARPRLMTAWVLIVVAGLGLFAHPLASETVRLWILLLTVHVVHLTGQLALVVPVRARLRVAALARTGLRALAIQLPVQAAGVLLVALHPVHAAGADPLAVFLGAAALIALGILIPVVRRART